MPNWLKKSLFAVKSHLPTRLPDTREKLDAYLVEMFQCTGIPDTPDNRLAACTMILHLGPSHSHVPRASVIRAVRKQQANEQAFGHIQKMKEDAKAAETAKTMGVVVDLGHKCGSTTEKA